MSHLTTAQIGRSFEKLIREAGMRQGVGYQAIKTTEFHGSFKSTQTPYDALLLCAGRAAAIDAKTLDQKSFPYAKITPHQRDGLLYLWPFGIPAGYLVWFRPVNIVTFFAAPQLGDLQPRDSLAPEDGITIGTVENMDLRRIFETNG